ncbi:hypothetical protein [Spiroplasma phoeniceum]|uniref:Uncharacterized protein n=1 Tax=Spiroplasma phoeniceum P40 TaxID=1276259 RepID=A0A345DLV0_9MOLU|nr:hypothetical protein [Spiroplasma phoeniceum]AXF95188.1 hypothetical protein SDAV_00193 [Spiroplasma phoeniceum P40]
MNITESIKFDKLKAENEALKKELDELKQQILYKEDFKEFAHCMNCGDDYFFNRCLTCGWKKIIDLKDNSKYDKLPSKEHE